MIEQSRLTTENDEKTFITSLNKTIGVGEGGGGGQLQTGGNPRAGKGIPDDIISSQCSSK